MLSKAPYSKRFEEAVGQACESAAARQVGRQLGLAASTVRAIDLRYLERWDARRREPPLRQMGVDEIYRGKKGKFLTVVCNLETAEPLWFGRERKQETLDDFFRSQLVSRQRKRIEAACVDMWEPFRLSMAEWVPGCRIVYDKFHIMQHANDAVDEVTLENDPVSEMRPRNSAGRLLSRYTIPDQLKPLRNRAIQQDKLVDDYVPAVRQSSLETDKRGGGLTASK